MQSLCLLIIFKSRNWLIKWKELKEVEKLDEGKDE